jgi:hypothetical protein
MTGTDGTVEQGLAFSGISYDPSLPGLGRS